MSQHKNESELEEYLEGEAMLSTAYRKAANEQAPEHLDAAILAASRQAVKSRPRYAFSPFASDWHLPVSLAAVLVLSVSVIVTMQNDSDEPYLKKPLLSPPSSTTVMSEDSLSGQITGEQDREIQDSQSMGKNLSEQELDSVSLSEREMSAVKKSIRPEITIAPASENIRREERSVVPSMAAPQHRADAAITSDMMQSSQVIPLEKTPVFETRQKVRNSDEARDEALMFRREQAETGSKSSSMETRDTDTVAKELSVQLNESVSVASGAGSANEFTFKPVEWIAYINQLWEQGETDEARKQLELFKQVHADYSAHSQYQKLPAELLQSLKAE